MNTLIAKGSLQNLMWSSTTRITPQYDLILGTNTMKELGIVLDFKAKMITINEVILPMCPKLEASKDYLN